MIENNTKITKDLTSRNTLIFYPKTVDEAVFIQKQLFQLGCCWEFGGPQAQQTQHVAESVTSGLTVRDGYFSFNPNDDTKKNAILCTSEQFAADYTPPMSKPEQDTLTEAFNALTEQVKALTNTVTAQERAAATRAAIKSSNQPMH